MYMDLIINFIKSAFKTEEKQFKKPDGYKNVNTSSFKKNVS